MALVITYPASANSSSPLQFQLYCIQHPNECKNTKSVSLIYSPDIKALLNKINNSVNRSIKPSRERIDKWSLNPKVGDCDDYVMTKRHYLIKAGIPPSILRIAIVKTKRGEGHAVLVVGDYVLDNLRKSIVKRNASGYRFIKISTSNPNVWNGE